METRPLVIPDSNGGGIYSCNTMSYLLNSILWGNEADEVELESGMAERWLKDIADEI